MNYINYVSLELICYQLSIALTEPGRQVTQYRINGHFSKPVIVVPLSSKRQQIHPHILPPWQNGGGKSINVVEYQLYM